MFPVVKWTGGAVPGKADAPKPDAPKLASKPGAPPRVLVVDDEPALVDLVADVVRSIDARIQVFTAASLSQARATLAAEEIELLVTDVHLPDGDGTDLLAALRRRRASARAIVMTGHPSVQKAIAAFRRGAVDFIPKPFSNDQLATHVRAALDAQARAAGEGRKLDRLRAAVKRLNVSRKLISKKVDLLCNDLVSAYGELSRQLESVRTQEGFRKALSDAKDLEQLLCHAMDFLLRQVGYANVAVWLCGEEGDFQLGAYMKYTVPGEPMLTDALRRVVLPIATRAGSDGTTGGGARDGVVRMQAEELADSLTPQEYNYLKGQELLAANCTYLGESLAALIFFRDQKTPFGDDDEALLQSIAPIFAVALAAVVRDGRPGGDDGDDDFDSPLPPDPSDGGLKDGDAPRPGPRKHPDSADWWKRGEPPPF